IYVPAHESSGSAQYSLHKITGTPASPVFTIDISTHTRLGGGWLQLNSGTDILPQNCTTTCPGTLAKIDAGDVYLRSNVVFRNGNIWYSQTVGLPVASGSPTVVAHTGVQWTRIDTSGNFVDGARLEVPTATNSNGGDWYAYPSIGVNANND